MAKNADTWAAADAKARFSEVLRRAENRGPQTITRSGRETVVVVAAEDWRRRTGGRRRSPPRETLGTFFARSPLRGSGAVIERIKDRPRDVDL
jgi:prevent-host-death family protein